MNRTEQTRDALSRALIQTPEREDDWALWWSSRGVDGVAVERYVRIAGAMGAHAFAAHPAPAERYAAAIQMGMAIGFTLGRETTDPVWNVEQTEGGESHGNEDSGNRR